MKLRTRCRGAIGGLALVAATAWAGEPRALNLSGPVARSGSANQRIAQEIAGSIARQVPARGYVVDVEFQAGIATLRGVADGGAQAAAILAAARTPDVKRVINQLEVHGSTGIATASLTQPPEEPMPAPMPAPMPSGGPNGAALPVTAPAPEHVFVGTGGQYESPFLPPFAWPLSAPYPNYSAAQYPTCYPAQAWPYIGPFHPYPEPPLDWRKVTLKWDDGHWYLKFYATCHSHKWYPSEW